MNEKRDDVRPTASEITSKVDFAATTTITIKVDSGALLDELSGMRVYGAPGSTPPADHQDHQLAGLEYEGARPWTVSCNGPNATAGAPYWTVVELDYPGRGGASTAIYQAMQNVNGGAVGMSHSPNVVILANSGAWQDDGAYLAIDQAGFASEPAAEHRFVVFSASGYEPSIVDLKNGNKLIRGEVFSFPACKHGGDLTTRFRVKSQKSRFWVAVRVISADGRVLGVATHSFASVKNPSTKLTYTPV